MHHWASVTAENVDATSYTPPVLSRHIHIDMSQEQLRSLRLVELLNAVRTTEDLADLHRPCTLLLGIGEWMKRAEVVGMKPESFPSDAGPATVSPIVTNGILHAENGDFVSMPSRGSLLNTLSPGGSAAESPAKHSHENANGFSAQDVSPSGPA